MKLVAITMFVLCSLQAGAQYTLNQSGGTLKLLEVNAVTFEQAPGNEITITGEGGAPTRPERAEGLKLLSAAGLEDNTGVGLAMTKDGTTTILQELSSRSDQRYLIGVPAGVSIYYECTTHQGEVLIANGLGNELEVSANFNDIKLVNPKGPLAISTVHGSIDANFDQVDQNQSISLHTVHDHVDVTVPANAKANFILSTSWGEMFTDLDLEFGEDGDMKRLSSSKMVGKFNGGGVDFRINSTHDDIYLRKK